MIAKKKKELGQETVLADIRCEMRLKPNTYKRYASFIENLLKELNEITIAREWWMTDLEG